MTTDLTPAQVAERLGLCRDTVLKLLRTGDLRSYRIGSGPRARWRVTEEALEGFRNPNGSKD